MSFIKDRYLIKIMTFSVLTFRPRIYHLKNFKFQNICNLILKLNKILLLIIILNELNRFICIYFVNH